MLASVGLMVLGFALLVAGGETLLRGAVGLATLLRLTPAVIGLTVVAAGTSVPELAVGATASAQARSDIAVGNVVGSNIFNIAGILGVCALVSPLVVTGNTIKLEYPVLALVTLLCLVIVQDGAVSRLDAVLCLAVYFCFTAYLVALVREQVTAREAQELAAEVAELATDTARPRAAACVALVAGGSALLAGGAAAAVTGSAELARLLGWSERFIGLTIVSVGTGLPELVASLISCIRGRTDVAIGNVIGSNLFNVLVILGLSSLVAPLPVQAALAERDCWWMLGVTLLLLPVLATGLRINRWEGGVLLAVYTTYLGLLLAEPT